jgi:hypothetical protein
MEPLFNAPRQRERFAFGEKAEEPSAAAAAATAREAFRGEDNYYRKRGYLAERVFASLARPGRRSACPPDQRAAELWNVAMAASDPSLDALLIRRSDWIPTADEAIAVVKWHAQRSAMSSWVWRQGRLVGVKRGAGQLERLLAVAAAAEAMLLVRKGNGPGAGHGPCPAQLSRSRREAGTHGRGEDEPLRTIEHALIQKYEHAGGWLCSDTWQCTQEEHSR